MHTASIPADEIRSVRSLDCNSHFTFLSCIDFSFEFCNNVICSLLSTVAVIVHILYNSLSYVKWVSLCNHNLILYDIGFSITILAQRHNIFLISFSNKFHFHLRLYINFPLLYEYECDSNALIIGRTI